MAALLICAAVAGCVNPEPDPDVSGDAAATGGPRWLLESDASSDGAIHSFTWRPDPNFLAAPDAYGGFWFGVAVDGAAPVEQVLIALFAERDGLLQYFTHYRNGVRASLAPGEDMIERGGQIQYANTNAYGAWYLPWPHWDDWNGEFYGVLGVQSDGPNATVAIESLSRDTALMILSDEDRAAASAELLANAQDGGARLQITRLRGGFVQAEQSSKLLVDGEGSGSPHYYGAGSLETWSQLEPHDSGALMDRIGGGQQSVSGPGWLLASAVLLPSVGMEWSFSAAITLDGQTQTSLVGPSADSASQECVSNGCLMASEGYASMFAPVNSTASISYEYHMRGPTLQDIEVRFEILWIGADPRQWSPIPAEVELYMP